MTSCYADLHIHIGRTMSGRPVKITGSRSLTLPNILTFSKHAKGLSMVGVIDCHSPEVITEIEDMIKDGVLLEAEGGGFLYGSDLCLIPGSEIEINDTSCSGPIHVLVYLPDLSALKEWSGWLAQRMSNITLSSQRIYAEATEVQQKTADLGGLFVPAHVFTPFKSMYGKGVKNSLTEVFDPCRIDGIELGLSSDTMMADGIMELSCYPFLTSSDAHSLEKIGREHMELLVSQLSFQELKMAIQRKDGRMISANFGLNPLLGKYYENVCADCLNVLADQRACTVCGSVKKIKGVSKRIEELKAVNKEKSQRPPYHHQVPLEFIPGIGARTLEKLRVHFGNDMYVLHHAREEELRRILPHAATQNVIKARNGQLLIRAGGGGSYGTIE
ncbi:endonuclease Q family protein [Fictibacillus iocasae]|uniref:Endonuclease Q family protein n=1 Tax=Fictibacillus iocasae TaxID=2715437 RepID=A0ABW2NPH9_9BACL